MRNIKVKVKWDFEDTEFEHLRYPEAIEISGLPRRLTIKNFDEEEIDIETYLSEEFGFNPLEWSIIE